MASKAKTSLINTFLDLVEREGYKKITVTSLVESCGISRQTFYYHFDDIHEMIEWAFNEETDKICKAGADEGWKDSAQRFVSFLNRYDGFLRSSMKTEDFIIIYNILCGCFKKYIASCLENSASKKNTAKNDYEILVNCIAASMAGLVAREIQKEESNYSELFKSVIATAKLLSQE
ncbi:MAG: TetR family transcriptional regulator [Eubacterium sp.]|nr:TetR family transcriptional regulator [Eubacterium sp.]